MADPAVKNSFYSDQRRHLYNTPANDMVLMLGDFNASVGKDSVAWKEVRGRHGIGNCDGNGENGNGWKEVRGRHGIGNCDGNGWELEWVGMGMGACYLSSALDANLPLRTQSSNRKIA